MPGKGQSRKHTAFDEVYDEAGNLISRRERGYDNDPLTEDEYRQLRQALKDLIAEPKTDERVRLLARYILNLEYSPYDLPAHEVPTDEVPE
jgi:hypothetical protein